MESNFVELFTGPADKKREAPSSQLSSSSQIPAKKPKPVLPGAASFTALGRTAVKAADPPSPSTFASRLEPWEDAAIEVIVTLAILQFSFSLTFECILG